MTAKGSGGAGEGERKARLAAALRANLKRRKAEIRERRGEAGNESPPERGDEQR